MHVGFFIKTILFDDRMSRWSCNKSTTKEQRCQIVKTAGKVTTTLSFQRSSIDSKDDHLSPREQRNQTTNNTWDREGKEGIVPSWEVFGHRGACVSIDTLPIPTRANRRSGWSLNSVFL